MLDGAGCTDKEMFVFLSDCLPGVMERMAQQGLIPVGSTSADFAAFQNAEMAKFRKIIQDANIKISN